MSNSRPKRKAAINKSYNDSNDFIDDDSFNSSSLTSFNSVSTEDRQRSKIAKVIVNNKKPANQKSLPPLPYNWQPPISDEDYFSIKLDLTDSYVDLNSQTLYCPNQTALFNNKRKKSKSNTFSLSKGQYIYLICEPPGDPYYVGRILGFKNKHHHDISGSKPPSKPIVDSKDYEFQIQWFYRPRDISKVTSDSRLLYSSMHSDSCPFASFRGLVTVKHKQDIEDEFKEQNLSKRCTNPKNSTSPSNLTALEVYTQAPNCFYFDKLFDRYMIKFYDVLSTNNLMQYSTEESKSKNFLKAINKRFEFIFVEGTRTKSLINSFSADSCNCELCGLWCDGSDSVTCVECKNYFHMYCLDPPLLKKPSRGFSWSCASCSKKHEIEYHQKKILMLSHDNKSSNQDQLASELSVLSSLEAESSHENDLSDDQSLPKYEIMAALFLEEDKLHTLEQRRALEEWPMRYLGANARLEEGVDLTDKTPYPRASTRLGAKHQAVYIPECNGHPLVYYDVEQKSPKKKSKERKKAKEAEEAIKKLEVPAKYKDTDPKDYPSWLQPRPKGYIERGVDDGEGETCTLLWKSSEADKQDQYANLDSYIQKCKPIAESIGMSENSPNFYDAILKNYMKYNGNVDKSYNDSATLTKKLLKEPVFTKEEIKRFEDAVKEFGSELHPVFKKVKTQPSSMIVRFWYLWKKTKNGAQIWGNFEGRVKKSKVQNKSKEEEKKNPVIDDLANPKDDSSFENDKIVAQKKNFLCKHCNTHLSVQWFKMTGHDSTKLVNNQFVLGLCFRCAKLWRRYAVVWEDPYEVQRKISNNKYGGWKKKVESELLQDSKKIISYAEDNNMSLSYNDRAVEESLSIDQPPSNQIEHLIAAESTKRAAPAIEADGFVPEAKRTKVKEEIVEQKKSARPVAQRKTNLSETKKSDPNKGKIKKTDRKLDHKRKTIKETNVKLEVILNEAAELEQNQLKADISGPNTKVKASTMVERFCNPAKVPHQKLSNMLLNKDYQLSQTYTDQLNSFTKEQSQSIIENFRLNQLTSILLDVADLKTSSPQSDDSQYHQYRNVCSICRDSTCDEPSSEMLLCASCGVNIHMSCAMLSLETNRKGKVIREWLCEPCINDLKPVYQCDYSCSLCFANENNHEVLSSRRPNGVPEYLIPMNSNGKWCHMICSIFDSENLLFKKDDTNKLAIGSASKTFVKNIKLRCEICKNFNGSIAKCDMCDDAFHITCAQNVPNFKLGFKLRQNTKDSQLVEIKDEVGVLKPVLHCAKHDFDISSLRTLGKRTTNRTEKPLIQLYLEDLYSRSSKCYLNGSNSKSMMYFKNCELLEEQIDQTSTKSIIAQEFTCVNCLTDTSPIWWPEGSKHLCQMCYHNRDRETKIESNLKLSSPLTAENYGIKNANDKLLNTFKPRFAQGGDENNTKIDIVNRSNISLGDILA